MIERYGCASELVICFSDSKYLKELKSKFPESYKREELDEEVGFEELVIAPITPQLKVAIFNPCEEGEINFSVFANGIIQIKKYCKEYSVKFVRIADDLCYGNKNAQNMVLDYIDTNRRERE